MFSRTHIPHKIKRTVRKKAPKKPSGHGFLGSIVSIAKRAYHDTIGKAVTATDKVVHETSHAVGVVAHAVSTAAKDIANLARRVDSLYNTITNFIGGIFSKFKSDVEGFIAKVPKLIDAAKNDVIKYAKALLSKAVGLIRILRKQVFDKIAHVIKSVYKFVNKAIHVVAKKLTHYVKIFAADIVNLGKKIEHYAGDLYSDVLNIGKKIEHLIEHLPDYIWAVIDKYFVKNFIKWFIETIGNVKFWEMLGEWILKMLEYILFDS